MRQFKYNLVCMQDGSTKSYCLDVEKSWNISALVKGGTVTWPNNTSKLFPDFSDTEGYYYYQYSNGSAMPLSAVSSNTQFGDANFQNNASVQGNMAGQDWYVNRVTGNYSNYGWPYALNYDEYPIQIQCSSCFLQKLQYGLTSSWGMIYDEIISQVWSNIQKNCKITMTFTAANNLTGVGVNNYTSPQYNRTLNGTSACTRYLTPLNANTSASDFAISNNVALMSLLEMNNIWNTSVGSQPLCAPAACQISTISARQSAMEFVSTQTSFSLPQFLQWNPFLQPNVLLPGESVCISPPGGAYTPSLTVAANATIYSTTAKPAAPTNSGTIPYCGLYYNVSSGDYCNLISQKFGITFNQLIGMNQAIDSNCTNLFLGYDYCVAPCCNSTIPAVTSTAKASSAPTSSSGVSATATSTYVSPPGPTQSGASSKCYKWYLVQSGDYCYSIEQTYGITQAQFLYWNPEVDSNCDIYSGYAYCVNGPPMPSSSTTATARSTQKSS